LLAGSVAKQDVLKLALPLAACALALTSGLALVAFVKAFAGAFLARARSPEAAAAQEAGPSMRGGMGLAALACLLLGLLPQSVLPVLGRVAEGLCGAPLPAFSAGLVLNLGPHGATLAIPRLAGVAAIALLAAWLLARAFMRGRAPVRLVPTWICGTVPEVRTHVTAAGFGQPLRQVFGRLLLPHAQELESDASLAPVFKHELRYRLYMEPVFEKYLYGPITRRTLDGSHWLTRIQGGSVHLYLAYIFVALLLALLSMRGLGA
jgi:hydrogenase-4 component B